MHITGQNGQYLASGLGRIEMHFKTARLMMIRNGTKRTICRSGGLGLLQIVSESNTGAVC